MSASAEGRIGGGTHVVGIVGWPVTHSLSPAIHNAAFAAAGLDWTYVPLPVPPDRLAPALAGLAALGIDGVNVTMPHKTEAAELIDDLAEDADLLRAVNTVVVRGDALAGHNTDVGGFERFLRRDAGFDPAGKSALLFGAGGAARACSLALARSNLEGLTVVARNAARTGGIRTIAVKLGIPVDVIGPGEVSGRRFDLVVNATPVGRDPEPDHVALPDLDGGVLVVDLLYDPPITRLQSRAKEAGATAFGGLGHLLEQAALSYELWTGTPAPLEVMSAAALAALADR
ncbi:MAG TPA: shikimate dehydrogenase [Actinomycetota bacterium]|nr:shikimate dehydrogenase [Actinomycetota bacterium]